DVVSVSQAEFTLEIVGGRNRDRTCDLCNVTTFSVVHKLLIRLENNLYAIEIKENIPNSTEGCTLWYPPFTQ
ncbi:MAG: hypothetical protein N0E44_22290, partial [Candidatus Thiodiazotropha lotti]|nr:hypothetical protein [Candidatus Thiodiazotropha lotti]MCW4222601.1 hypothetical protein [Candidatus Thiodiazotropha lotti]